MLWGVRAYREWRINRLNYVINFDVKMFEANIDSLCTLTKENLEYAMCRFIPEVTKVNDGVITQERLYMKCVLLFKDT